MRAGARSGAQEAVPDRRRADDFLDERHERLDLARPVLAPRIHRVDADRPQAPLRQHLDQAAGGEFLGHGEGRGLQDAVAAQRRIDQRHAVVGAQAAAHRD
ncbi:hypothetical protein CATMIT_01905, partial [Catenibacterium mitsuokai DSM 15897]